MSKEEFIRKLQMVYIGDRNCFNEIVSTYDKLKEDIKNIIRIIDKNCDDLEATEEEFESLERWKSENN